MDWMNRETRTRNLQIMEQFHSGAAYSAIARDHGLSRFRVKEVICRMAREREREKDLNRIYDSGLSLRVKNVLAREGLERFDQIRDMSDAELYELQGMGRTSLKELRAYLKLLPGKQNVDADRGGLSSHRPGTSPDRA